VRKSDLPNFDDILAAYEQIPEKISAALCSVLDDKLEIRCAKSQMSLRETVHHIVEANIVAASMMIAALGSDRATLHWAWLWPGRDWGDRMHYDPVPPEAALTTLDGLIQHIVNMIRVRDDAGERKVSVHDLPGDTPYFRTIAEILVQEAKHVDEHLDEIMSTIRT